MGVPPPPGRCIHVRVTNKDFDVPQVYVEDSNKESIENAFVDDQSSQRMLWSTFSSLSPSSSHWLIVLFVTTVFGYWRVIALNLVLPTLN